MSWPLASHFSAMLQNPRVAFRDPRLQGAAIEKNERNQPRPWAGQFAVVYKAIDPDGQKPFAVRVFTTESPERRERYELISAYLKARKLKCLVDFDYRDKSIRSAGDGKWYPLIVMDWVQGETLYQWLRARCLETNGQAIAALADRWLEAVKELADAQVAHGDFQHANVMVTPQGEIKLVDYDGMCVPSLVGRRNLEVGVEPYQHPGRNERTLLSPDLDNFSSLMVFVVLKALALNPGLWMKYVEQPGYDKLLFRTEDFEKPQQSPLCYELVNLGTPEFHELVDRLLKLWHGPVDEVLPLSYLAHSYGRVEQLLKAQQWKEAVEQLNHRGHFRDAPEYLRPLIQQAYEFVCREEAWAAFSKLTPEISETNDRQAVEAWNEALFAGYAPAEKERSRVADARKRVNVLDRLRHIVQQTASKPTLDGEKTLAAAAGQLPEGYKYSLRQRVEQARRRLTALVRLDRAMRNPSSEANIVTAWKAVVEAKAEPFVNLDWGMRIALAEERVKVLRALGEIANDLPPHEYDKRILGLWRQDLLDECEEALLWRPAYELAVERRKTLEDLHAAIRGRDEPTMIKLAQSPQLAGYALPDGWTRIITVARRRLSMVRAIWIAVRDGQTATFREQFDVRIVRAYADRLAAHWARLVEWVRSEILPAERCGLQPAAEGQSLASVTEPEGNWRVQWTWPEPRWADKCLLAVCPTEPGPQDDPQALSVHFRETIEYRQWEKQGSSQLLMAPREWEGSSVVVWAAADLGTTTIYGSPLVLGRIESRSWFKWKGLRLFGSRRGEVVAVDDEVAAADNGQAAPVAEEARPASEANANGHAQSEVEIPVEPVAVEVPAEPVPAGAPPETVSESTPAPSEESPAP